MASRIERLSLGRMQNPVRGFVHGAAAIAAAIGLIALLSANPGGLSVALSLAIYATSLVMMFSISSLYHSIPWSDDWKRRMRRLDHAAIFLVVAGTYTPIAVVALDTPWMVSSLAAVWATAVVGIVLKLTEKKIRLGLSVTLQNVMGWAAVIPMWQIGARLGGGTVVWIALGGVVYTGGMVMFLTRRPRLFPRVFSAHELFHVMVVLASAIHFFVIFRLVLPAAA